MRRIAAALLLLVAVAPLGQANIGAAKVGSGRMSPDGSVEIQIDLPDELHKRNIGSPRPNGPGCCVFRSLDHAARWANIPALWGMPEWMADHKPVIPGGGYPEKVARLIPQICKERGLEVPDFLQVRGDDLEIVKAACRSGRMVSSTYYFSPTGRYGGRKISHMVNTTHADDRWFCVLDNNYVGSARNEWMDPETYRRVIGGKQAWFVILLGHGPPLPPCN